MLFLDLLYVNAFFSVDCFPQAQNTKSTPTPYFSFLCQTYSVEYENDLYCLLEMVFNLKLPPHVFPNNSWIITYDKPSSALRINISI